jgi:hypothetical protein
MTRGECNCGAVQFEIDADLTDVFVCHCSICRRSTGSNGIAVVVVLPDLRIARPGRERFKENVRAGRFHRRRRRRTQGRPPHLGRLEGCLGRNRRCRHATR